MKKKIIFEIFLMIIGIILIVYPIISECIFSYNQTMIISNYQQNIDNMSKSEKDKELQKAKEYNEKLEQETAVDISLSNKNETNSNNNNARSYLNVLNIGEIIAYINIPIIDVYLPIYHGTSEDVLQSGVGHINNTSLPVGGVGTHAVLVGHTGLARTKIFDNLDKLKIGDKFYISVLGKNIGYEVDEINIVEPDDTDTIKVDKNEDYVTLVTCTPKVLNTYRLLVRGKRMSDNEEDVWKIDVYEKSDTNEVYNIKKQSKIKLYSTIIITILIIVIFFIIIFWEEIKNRRKNSKR